MATNTYDIKIGGGVKPEVFASLGNLNASLASMGANLSSRLLLPLGTFLSGAQLTQFIGNAARAADALGDLREETGLAIETLGGLKLAADIKGLGDIDLPMKKFSAAVREAQVEGTEFNELFKKMGVDPMRELDTVLFDVADKFSRWEDGINKLGIAEELFGTRQTRFIQLLNMGSDGLKENIGHFRDTHGSVEAAADMTDEYNKQLVLLKSSAEGAAQSLVANLGPALTNTLKITNKLAEAWANNPLLQGPVGRWLMSPSAANAGGGASAAPNKPDAPNHDTKATPAISDELKHTRELYDMEIERVRLETDRGVMETINQDRKNMIVEAGLQREIELLNEKRALLADVDNTEADKLELQDKKDLLQVEQAYKSHLDRKTALEKSHQQELQRLRTLNLTGVSDMFSNMATVAEVFGKKGMVAYRAFATAQAVMDTARAAIGAYSSVVSIPYIGPVLAPIAAGAAVAVGAAQIAKINGAFLEGGFTGNMGTNEVAGVVHGREFVIPANRVSEFGVDYFERIRTGEIKPAEAAAGTSAGAGGMNANFALVNNRNEMREFMVQEGWKIVHDQTSKRSRQV